MTTSYEPFAGFDAAASRGPGGPPEPPAGPRAWLRDLALGARFAAGGGREGWTRTALTAVGVSLGVALLLLAAAVPAMMDARDHRRVARDTTSYGQPLQASDRTLLVDATDTTYRDQGITGILVHPEGPHAPVPPGLSKLPAAGTMVASPALQRLLRSTPLLRERLPYTLAGTIGHAGLMGPAELYYYAGSDQLVARGPDGADGNAQRLDSFGHQSESDVLGPVFDLLLLTVLVVLLLPVAVFIGTAVRLGGERRDRRLAALRLVGADIRTTRRVAAGEALFGSVLGLLLGGAVFAVVRQFTGDITIRDISAYPADMTPNTALAVLIALAVPVSAVAVTLLGLRRTVIEPLGVVRQGVGRKRSLWWRLMIPAVGVALLAPLFGTVKGDAHINEYQIATGTVLLLVGVTAVLPWVVESVVGRMRGGPVSWQLATRRLQLNSNASARMVAGVTVAVAGAIALQMLFHAVDGDFVLATGADPNRAEVTVWSPVTSSAQNERAISALAATKGVKSSYGYIDTRVTQPDASRAEGAYRDAAYLPMVIGDCDSLRELVHLLSCAPGDSFLVPQGPDDHVADDHSAKYLKAGGRVDLNADHADTYAGTPRLWTIPAGTRQVTGRTDPTGQHHWGLFVTRQAIGAQTLSGATSNVMLTLDKGQRDAVEYVRNTAARFGLGAYVANNSATKTNSSYTQLRRGLFAGATLTMALIGASLLVTMLEQLRDRRKLLAVLVAFGTRRSALAWSVLWQTAIPVVLGLLLACAGGVGLGAALLAMVGRPFAMDWGGVAVMTAVGGAVVLAVTLLSLPPLWRLMRPDGLHTE